MGGIMEIFTENDLLLAVEQETLIKNGRKESCEGIKYDFTLSNMALTVDAKGPIDIDQSKENAVIKPGEIAFVMTKEALNLPDDIYCQLSAKRKLSLDGIVILGGLIIDPNYKGKLIFGLYNISSRIYPLLPGKKLVADVFYRVDKKSDKQPEPINDFPDELIKIVVDNKPNSINAVFASVERLRAEIQEVKNKLDRDENWRIDFQTGLTEIKQLVKTISEKLDTEVDTRQREINELTKEQIELRRVAIPMSEDQKRYQTIKVALITLIITVAGGGLTYIIVQLIGKLIP
jgi:deoxycytidine triphosphate deaminase